MKTEIKQVMIDPAQAKELLQRNKNNRNVRENQVEALAAAMTRGDWELSNDAIVVSEGGLLLNGQHRLLAVIRSGVVCPFILFTGASDSSFDIMDTPTIRRISDVIQRKGGTNTVRCESVIGKFLNLCYDMNQGWETVARFNNRVEATRKARIEVYETLDKDIHKWLNICDRLLTQNITIAPITLLAAFSLFLEKSLHHPEEKITDFLKELCIDGRSKNGTILHVRKKLIRHKMKADLLPRHDDFRYIIRAWNDFLQNRSVQTINTREESFRYIRPF